MKYWNENMRLCRSHIRCIMWRPWTSKSCDYVGYTSTEADRNSFSEKEEPISVFIIPSVALIKYHDEKQVEKKGLF